MAPSARPVKPIPVSTRKERRVMPGQRWEDSDGCDIQLSSLSYRHKIVVIQQHMDQVLSCPQNWIGCGKFSFRNGTHHGRRSQAIALFLLAQEFDTGLQLLLRRWPREHLLECRPDEACRSATHPRRQVVGQESGMLDRQFAIGQGERLLWQHAFLALIALRHRGAIEELEELHLLFLSMAEI